MKKILTVLLSFLFLSTLISCTSQNNTNESTSSADEVSSAFLSENATAAATAQTSDEASSNKNQTNAAISETEATEASSSDSVIHNENSALQILFLTLDDITAVESACNNLAEEQFMQFISEHPKDYEANGINSRSDAKDVIDELKETTIVLLDNDAKNVSEMYFYLERNEIQQPVLLENDKKIICTYYTPQNTQNTSSILENDPDAEFLDEITVNDIPVKIYQIQGNDSYFAEFTVNNTSIFCRITNMENVEEIKASFNRLTFVKIGDLLNQ